MIDKIFNVLLWIIILMWFVLLFYRIIDWFFILFNWWFSSVRNNCPFWTWEYLPSNDLCFYDWKYFDDWQQLEKYIFEKWNNILSPIK